MAVDLTIDRLKSQLLTSGLSQKDQPLFQVINQLIDYIRNTSAEINTLTGGGGGGGGSLITMPFLTYDDVQAILPNSRQLTRQTGISFNKTPQKLIISTELLDYNKEPDYDMGPPGPPGLQGPSGPIGLMGPPGMDAYCEGYENPTLLQNALSGGEILTLTTTGNIDDLDFANARLIRMNNASLATIRGLKAGSPGQLVTIVSIGAGQVDFAHQNAGSLDQNRLINFTTSGITPIAAGVGTATYTYDIVTTKWRLISHTQGAWIDVPYDAGLFTSSSGTWTVDAGDVQTYQFYLNGRQLAVACILISTSISVAAPQQLRVTLPNGYTFAAIVRVAFAAINGGVDEIGMYSYSVAGTFFQCFTDALGAGTWTIGANNTNVYISGFCTIQ